MRKLIYLFIIALVLPMLGNAQCSTLYENSAASVTEVCSRSGSQPAYNWDVFSTNATTLGFVNMHNHQSGDTIWATLNCGDSTYTMMGGQNIGNFLTLDTGTGSWTNGVVSFWYVMADGPIRDTCTGTYLNGPVNVQDQITSQIKVYPNPSNGQFIVSIPEAMIQNGSVEMNIYAMDGRKTSTISIPNSGEFHMDLQGMAHGLYLYELRDASGLSKSGRLMIH